MRVNMTITSVLMIRSSVIYTHRVRYHTQSTISTRCVVLKRKNVTKTLTTVISTQSVILTRMSVIMTLMSVITTRTSVIYTRTSGISQVVTLTQTN
jgi:hypothetical protein